MDKIEEINASLKQVSDQIKAHAEKAEKEIKAHAKLSEETRASVDELLTQQGELKARLLNAELMVAKLEQNTGYAYAPKSIGATFTESDEFKQYQANPRGTFAMRINAAVTTDGGSSGSNGDLIAPHRVPGIQMPPQYRLTIRDLILWGRTNSNSVEFARELAFTNNANVVSENPSGGKPESDITFEADFAPIVDIAHTIQVTNQILADVPQLQSYINGRMQRGLKEAEEEQLLNGSGMGKNINGIMTQADDFSFSGINVQNETRVDRLRLAILQAELTGYSADGIVLSVVDWGAIELTKDATNSYLFTNARTTMQPTLWGRNVVVSGSMAANDFLVGVFGGGLAVQGWDREDMDVQISFEDRDNFIKNMATIRVEERVGLTVYRPDAFVAGDFSDLDSSSI